MKFSLKSKTAIVTGGGSGIGQAIAKNFAGQLANVIILDLNEKESQKTVAAIRKDGYQASYFVCDVSSQEQVYEIINKKVKGKIDILVNSAGIAHIGNINKTKEADLDRLYNVNIKGVYNCMKACIENFQKYSGGVIVNLASVASSVGICDRFAYSMTKGAVLTMSYSVAKDFINENIRCNCVSPARVYTSFVKSFLKENYPNQEKEMFEKLSKTQPIGRMGTPQEIADLALYLCSDEASFITGSNYSIDGGFEKLNGN